MLSTLLLMLLPTVVVAAAVHFKLPDKAKAVFFKVPVVLSAFAINWLVVHSLITGVTAGYALLLGDLLLTPALALVKSLYERRQRKSLVVNNKQTPALAMPAAA